jgi:crossover junction endodeoxyribonuclease RuvC
MRVLGVDPGSRVCGYAVVAVGPGRSCLYVECGVLTSAHRAPEARLGEIARGLAEVIEELGPAGVAVEDVFSHRNPRSALALAQARGAVLAVAGMRGLPVHSYAPALVKKTVTGRGRADKDQVARMVKALVGLASLPTADAADALAVALTHARVVALPARIAAAGAPAVRGAS